MCRNFEIEKRGGKFKSVLLPQGGGLLTGQASLTRPEAARLGFLVGADPDSLKDALDSVYAELRALNNADL